MVIGVEFFRVKAKVETTIAPVVKKVDKSLYYINTNEIPSELSHKNMVAWRYDISLLVLKKIFHSFTALTREIFFNIRREISYLRAAM